MLRIAMTEVPGAVFKWGDVVRVRDDAPADFRPGAKVLIIGVFGKKTIQRLRYRKFHDVIVYAAEYDDGYGRDIEQKWLIAP